MRLPVTVPISTKDGTSNKNARLTNCLKESKIAKDKFVWVRGVKQPAPPIDKVVVRPGLVTQVEGTGVGGGLVAFNNELVSVYGTTLGTGPVGELNEWTTYTLGTYTIVNDYISTIPNADGVSSFLIFNGHLYRTADGQTIIDVGVIYNNGSGGSDTVPQYFNTSTNKWYAIEETYDVDLDEYTYTFDTSNDGLTWTQIAAYTAPGNKLFSIGSDIYSTKAGIGQAVYKSTNGGASFTNVATLPSAITIINACVNIDGIVYICGAASGNYPRVMYTNDGVNYTTVDLPFASGNQIVGMAKSNGKIFLQIFNTPDGTIDTYYCDSLSANALAYTVSDSYAYSAFGQTTVGINAASGHLIHTFSVPSGGNGTIKTKVLGGGVITALATIQTGLYDFAQGSI